MSIMLLKACIVSIITVCSSLHAYYEIDCRSHGTAMSYTYIYCACVTVYRHLYAHVNIVQCGKLDQSEVYLNWKENSIKSWQVGQALLQLCSGCILRCSLPFIVFLRKNGMVKLNSFQTW